MFPLWWFQCLILSTAIINEPILILKSVCVCVYREIIDLSTRGLDYNFGSLIDPRCVYSSKRKYVVLGVVLIGFFRRTKCLRLFKSDFVCTAAIINYNGPCERYIIGHSHWCSPWTWSRLTLFTPSGSCKRTLSRRVP